MSHRSRGTVLLALLCSTPLALAAGAPVPKQLAGPPAEFAAMRAPDPAASAIHSRSALLAVTLDADRSGRLSWQGPLPIEHGRARLLVFGSKGAWQVELAAPGRPPQPASSLAVASRASRFGLSDDQHPVDYFAFDGLDAGVWNLRLSAPAGASRNGYLLIEGDAGTELASYQTHRRQLVGEAIGIAAVLTAADARERITIGAGAGRVDLARLKVTGPDGRVQVLAMADDGRHDDGAAGDGVFGARFTAEAAGDYLAQVEVHGVDRHGARVIRTAEHLIPVVRRSLQLSPRALAVGAQLADERMAVSIPVDSDRPGRHYRVYAELWGRAARGDAAPVAWLSGMVEARDGALQLGLDERWLLLAGTRGGYELRNLRIEDPDHFVPVAEAAVMPLELPAVRSMLTAAEVRVDERMTMGVRPAGTALQGVGRRLLLVHGYCSGGVWPAAQFTTASTFLDRNQSRSNDQFARLIQSFGSTWNSFGTVAHSQGGMASLHLYAYYWSGLDNATGNRLIQSVGTPYRGTNLAGILATLGSWFGVGCGNNSNLTYSGAQSWLSGIPTWARAKVNYYTTAFRSTNWWTNDYCNAATDLVLSDPEDGTTEQVNGQLAGAINRGHTAGQCHTTGMRDPAQYLDSNRNAVMNSNAAR